MNSPRTPSWIQRLRAEIRSACGSVDSSRPAAASSLSPAPHAHPGRPIGEWLGTVRQPTDGFSTPARLNRPNRHNPLDDLSFEHGDLMRTHVTRIKGARATLRY